MTVTTPVLSVSADSAADQSYIRGDADGDGKITVLDAMFETWFEKNTISSYYTGAYPWTRLGHTYDWADNGTDYGLSEFIIFKGAEVTVECTYDLEAFAEYAKNQI